MVYVVQVWCLYSIKTPDDGQGNCMKHAEFYSKNKFEKLVHLVGFIIRTSCAFWELGGLCMCVHRSMCMSRHKIWLYIYIRIIYILCPCETCCTAKCRSTKSECMFTELYLLIACSMFIHFFFFFSWPSCASPLFYQWTSKLLKLK